MIKLDGPEDLKAGDRVFIDGEFAYEVIADPTVPWSGNAPSIPPLDVRVRYRDGGDGVRTFDPEVSWEDMNVEVQR